jgi:hypothetical protein
MNRVFPGESHTFYTQVLSVTPICEDVSMKENPHSPITVRELVRSFSSETVETFARDVPWRVVVGGPDDGYIYIADRSGGRSFRITPDRAVEVFADVLKGPATGTYVFGGRGDELRISGPEELTAFAIGLAQALAAGVGRYLEHLSD